jgi:hypothetical protein
MKLTEFYTVETHEKGVEMRVLDQHDQPTDVYLTLAGLDSPQCRNAMKEAAKKAAASEQDAQHTPTALGILTADDILVACTIGWRGMQSDNGETAQFSRKAAIRLYQQAPYVMYQAQQFIYDRRSFTKA